MSLHRRDFIEGAAVAGLAEFLGPRLFAELTRMTDDASAPIPRRPLGKTGETLSVLGFGGIVAMGGTQQEANNRVAEAIARGVNYFDVSPSYGKGEAEEKLGPALKPYRNKVFLACKTGKRDKESAAEELRDSLKRLQTGHFDLYQMHSVLDVDEDVERALGPGGAIEAFLEAKRQGLVRFIGFSSHSIEAALKMIASGHFDTILHPVNFVCHYHGRFDEAPLEAAKEKAMGRLALKSMARTKWPEDSTRETRPNPKCWYQPITDPAEAALAIRWTLSQGVTAAIPPGDENLFRVALNVASKDKPLSPEEESALMKLASTLEPIFPQSPNPKKKRDTGVRLGYRGQTWKDAL